MTRRPPHEFPARRRAGTSARGFRRRLVALAALCLALAALCAVGMAVGSRIVPLHETWNALWHYSPKDGDHVLIRQVRIPRTAIAVAAGSCLGLAGVLTQSLTRNALAEPGTLGVNHGAAAGVVVGLSASGGSSILVYTWFAFAGAAAAGLVVHRLGRANEAGENPTRLVLAGAALSILLGSTTTIAILSRPETVHESFRGWATGSLQGRGWESLWVALACLAVGACIAAIVARSLDVAVLGRDAARGLGANTRTTWALANLAVVVLAGGATAATGPIAFVGLASPHIARTVGGSGHARLLPLSALLGAMALLTADVLGRVADYPDEIGAGVMAGLIGAPFFVALVRGGRIAGI